MYKQVSIKRFIAIVLAMVMVLGNTMVVRADDDGYDYESEKYVSVSDEKQEDAYYPDAYAPEQEYESMEEYPVYDEYDAQDLDYIAIAPMSASLFSGGNGTSIPFMIATSADLMLFSELTTGFTPHDYLTMDFFNRASYVLVNDIDMENLFNFRPIGFQQHNAFNGSFNGNGFTISNLLISFDWRMAAFNANINSLGMFGFVQNADIHNVNLVNPQIVVAGHDRDNIGFLIGTAINSRVSDITVTGGNIDAREASNVGSIAGLAQNTTFENITITDTTIEGVHNVGGVAGQITDGHIITATINMNVSG